MPQLEHNSEKFGYINLESMDGVQTALSQLGQDPSKIDGKTDPPPNKRCALFKRARPSKSTALWASRRGNRW